VLRLLGIVAFSGLLAAGCKVYDPALVGMRDGAVPGDGGSACGIRPPPRSSAADDGVNIGEIAFAVRDVVFEQGADWRRTGYDLDGFCTAAPDYEAGCAPPDGSRPVIDGDTGIDNVFGQTLFPLVSLAVPGLQMASRTFQEAGDGSVLIRIVDWNGQLNDSRVDVVAAVTVFGTTAAAAPDVTITATGPELSDGTFPPPPAWDDEDVFWGREDNFVGGNESNPRIRDDNAYVTNGTLVVRLPERTDFIFPGTDVGVLVRLTEAFATGRISDDRTRLENVTVAGRWAINDLLDTAEAIGVCPGTPDLMTLQRIMDMNADVRSRADTSGPGVSCDAVSIAIQFTGYRGHWGGIAPGRSVPNSCDMM
jgi:hypothetical protein